MQIIQGTIYRILELISRNKRFSFFRITRLTICIMVLVLFASSSDAITRFDALAAIPGRQSQLQTPHPPSEDITVFLPLLFKPASDLKGRVKEHTVTLPHSLGTNVYNWCTWGSCQISPRLYHAPMNGGGTLVGWMDSSGNGHISVIDATGSLGDTYDYSNKSIRGLVAHQDGTFAILLWNPSTKVMRLTKRNADDSLVWSTNIDHSMTSFNPHIGDSRLAYGNGTYGAYFAVHGDSGWPEGHEGDQLSYVDSDGIATGGWMWGCSHSMAELIDYHPTLAKWLPVCSSDCYDSKGILLNDNQAVYACDGNCGGLVSAQLGQVAQAEDSWKLVFSALDRPSYDSKGIGLATINGDFSSARLWLTDSNGQYERDPVLARLGSALDSNHFLVGWKTTNDNTFWLAVIDGSGNFIEGPEEVSSKSIGWGNRDDSMRTRPDGDVSWVQGAPGSNTLHLYRFSAP